MTGGLPAVARWVKIHADRFAEETGHAQGRLVFRRALAVPGEAPPLAARSSRVSRLVMTRLVMTRLLVASTGAWVMLAAAGAAADPLRVALVEAHGSTPAVEALHGEQGFRLGLDYATHGTLAVRGRSIELAVIDAGTDAEAASALAACYRDGKAELAVAFGASERVLALLPVAAAAKRILLVAEAHADAITGGAGNRYVFRTAASAGQQGLAEALALARPELNLFVAAQDTRDGRDAVAALKAALERRPSGAFYVGALLLPPRGSDIGGAVSAEYDGFHDLHAAKTLLTVWSGAAPPIEAIAATDPGRFGIRLAFGGDIDPNAPLPATALEGVTAYLDALPHNPVNDWLVAAWRHHYRERPDGFAAGGMTAAIALIAALQAAPVMETEALAATMEGLRFDTAKGGMIFRKEDHQALQVMYHFRSEPQTAGGAPELVHEFAIPELTLPIGSGHD
jgi:branched-chain amino acid transport system substrate-binding protein